MFDALYIGATGMRGQQMQIDAIAHNVANLNTVGFKRSTVSFAEIAAALADASVLPTGLPTITSNPDVNRATGNGAMPTLTLSTTMGELKQTGDPLSVAIDGPGYLEVIRADGSPAYTRSGQLRVNSDGWLAAADGSPLAAHIEVPTDARELRIAFDGRVTAVLSEGGDPTELGRIELVGFANPSGLEALGGNLYIPTERSGEAQTAVDELGFGSLRQGFLEGSNVQMTDELVSLMLAQRAFEMNSRVIQAADQLLAITNGLYK